MLRCRECDSDLYVYDSIDTTCTACGLVNASHPMQGTDRAVNATADAADTHRVVHYIKHQKVKHALVSSTPYRSHIYRLADQLDIKSNVAEDAISIFEAVKSRPTWRKRKQDNMLAMYGACIYHACSRNGLHRPTHFISSRLSVSDKRVKNMIKQSNPQHAVKAAPLSRSYVPHIVYNYLGIDTADAKRMAAEAAATAPAIERARASHNTDTVTAVILTECASRLGLVGLETKVCTACNDVAPATVRQLTRGLPAA
jgi:transcription initiation factor TFIIIB Brf1 subunit/transcription initiation factor TFIIB